MYLLLFVAGAAQLAAATTIPAACKPPGGCCDFSGIWMVQLPPVVSHHITQSANCSISYPWKGCHGRVGTASGETLDATCTGFYDGELKGILELADYRAGPYDVLRWSNGAAWYRKP
jgi:hypothetical protein